jgi:hypothetical protein
MCQCSRTRRRSWRAGTRGLSSSGRSARTAWSARCAGPAGASPHSPAAAPAALLSPQLREIVCRRRRSQERPDLVPLALGAATAGHCETFAGRWLLKQEVHLRQEFGLIRLDHKAAVPLGLADLGTERVLAVVRIPGHQSALQRHLPQQGRGRRSVRPGPAPRRTQPQRSRPTRLVRFSASPSLCASTRPVWAS